jgi:hypothetical protein
MDHQCSPPYHVQGVSALCRRSRKHEAEGHACSDLSGTSASSRHAVTWESVMHRVWMEGLAICSAGRDLGAVMPAVRA